MAAKYLLLTLLLVPVAAFAATGAAVLPLAPTVPAGIAAEPWPPHRPIRLVAIRVEFQPDNVTGTTGTGLMGSGLPDSLTIDPLPHHRAYFEDHLRFLRHYYQTVSDGAVVFDTTATRILPEGDSATYRLDHPMWHYNYNSDDDLLNRRLVELFVEATSKAASDVNFADYDAVLIFHAGVGKDFNLGFDATPFDIPSAYISPADLQGYVGDVALPSGVTRGLILPESENQPEVLEFDIELSLNGILVKLFGNWLGLPDLFDTGTGRSGVGRWAMMDQGSGNVLALVPAYPDAWSRLYMGWDSARVVVPSLAGDTVQVARIGTPGAPRVVKLPVTPREYYLIENRDADADSVGYVELRDRDGRIMRSTWDGTLTVEPGFGVAVEASHYDFGIPGSGLLIWHIDEDVIEAGLSTNTVNTNPDHRGVDLVEADGAQDIGREYGFASAGSGTELGWQGDAWERDNAEHRGANGNALQVRFADRTFPPARLHDRAFTGLDLTAFSPIDSVMSFVARSTTAAPGFPVTLPAPGSWTLADLNGDRRKELYVLAGDSLYSIDSAGTRTALAGVPANLFLAHFDPPVDLDGDSLHELLFGGDQVGRGRILNGSLDLLFSGPLGTPNLHPYPARSVSGAGRILVLDQDEDPQPPNTVTAALFDWNLQLIDAQEVIRGNLVSPLPYNIESLPANRFVFVADGQAAAFGVSDGSLDELWRVANGRIQPSAVVVAEPTRRTVYLANYGYVEAETGDPICLEPDCIAPQEDWNDDGIADGGGPLGRSDLAREDAPRFTADTAWVIDVDALMDPDLVGYYRPQRLDLDTVWARVHAVKHNGDPFPLLPRAASIPGTVRPFEWGNDRDLYYLNVAQVNEGYAYAIHRLADARGGQPRFAYREDVAIVNLGPLRPQVNRREDWLYCWPNPASDVSRIRITLDYPAEAEVRIFDLAGRQVAELRGNSSAPGPLAFELPWDVSHVESGIYVGRVIVRGNGTSRESQVKIAVVK